MQLHAPWILLCLLLAPLAGWLMARRSRRAQLRFSTVQGLHQLNPSWRVFLRSLLWILRIACIMVLVIALARPQHGTGQRKISTKGVVLSLVVDRSGSMQAEQNIQGQTLNRLEVVKRVLKDFIDEGSSLPGRPNDLLGLVTFARNAETACPLVYAHDALLGFLDQTKIVTERSEDGTAIGDAVALAAARLHQAEQELARRNAPLLAKSSDHAENPATPDFEIQSKAIVLLTDGVNNAGDYDPLEAAELAKKWGIKIYTIGIGGGESFVRIQTPFGTQVMPAGQELDEQLLKQMAQRTGGFYGRADDLPTLLELCKKIDQQEKTQIQTVAWTQFEERFTPWALAAFTLLAAEVLLGCTVFRKIP